MSGRGLDLTFQTTFFTFLSPDTFQIDALFPSPVANFQSLFSKVHFWTGNNFWLEGDRHTK